LGDSCNAVLYIVAVLPSSDFKFRQ